MANSYHVRRTKNVSKSSKSKTLLCLIHSHHIHRYRMPSTAKLLFSQEKTEIGPSNAKLRVESKPQIISVEELPGRAIICGDHLRTLPAVETCGHGETIGSPGSAMNHCRSSVEFWEFCVWNRSSRLEPHLIGVHTFHGTWRTARSQL